MPLAVVEHRRVLAANRCAHGLGVSPGANLAAALALAPTLQVRERSPQQESACVERLALALGALSPRLYLQASGVLVEVQGSLRLFGGIRRLLWRAQELVESCGLHPVMALAPTAGAAWLLAGQGAGRRRSLHASSMVRLLDALPAQRLARLLELTPQQQDLLQMLGCDRLGELRALPRAGLRKRIGAPLVDALARAYGEAPDPRTWFEPPERFSLEVELPHRADDAHALEAALAPLLQALVGWLHLRWQAASVLRLRLVHDGGRHARPDTELRLQLGAPVRDAAHLALLWRERLQRQALAAPVYRLGLALDESVQHAGVAGELLPSVTQDAQARSALLDRLRARLGAERVRRLEPLADHRPERAQRWVEATLAAVPARTSTGTTAPPRPLWLLDPPQPLALDAQERPLLDGGALHLLSRAERIEAGWFDGAPVRRDYHVAFTARHRLCWVYRERRDVVASARNGGWFLHGWFA
ncbi:protein ImuB [Rivibacter subsaxonicus]|uniref:Protein ImuB n=1 Tax=Rivibacter subsaxonicus TaxID=457575 RepID=A0A4Q7VAG4_9BURK|nr:protein ImuB [Rivibacter subsaxonicus]